MKICLKCMKYQKADMMFCPECSERLTDVDDANQPDMYRSVNPVNNPYSNANEERTVFAGPDSAGIYNDNRNVYNAQQGVKNPYAPPVNMNNNYQQPQTPNQGANKGLYALIGIFVAIIVVSGMIILALLMINGDKDDESSAVHAEESETQAVEVVVETTTAQPETQAPTTTYQSPAERLSAYNTFNSFYNSYLDGINFMDSGYLGYCSETVRYEMIERFQYNNKSLFDLRRIDFDEESYSSYTSGGRKYHSFYVKCVSEYYDRNTYANKGYNYAVWYTTVTQEGDYYYVSFLERNDEYQMGSNVHTITDNIVLNYSYF